MNVLVDHHHGALLRSFYYLFKKRFNFNVFVPTGFDWLDKDGLYSVYPHRETADQMLFSWLGDGKFMDVSLHTNMFLPITHEEFINMDIDIIVCTLYENYTFFKQMIDKYSKKTKLILQSGNNITPSLVELAGVKNLLSSTYPTYIECNDIHKVFYRQEFNQEVFKPKESCNIKSVANFKHIMQEDFNIILDLEKKMPDWEFKCYGCLNRDGNMDDRERDMSDAINRFGFIFHVKSDDGYGHVIHNSFACGKPMIIDLNTARVCWNGKFIRNTASFLYEKDKTIIDVNDGIDQIVYKLKYMADNYDDYKNNVINKYNQVVDFDREFIEVKKFIENLI